jgi:signal transduction histidine kinase
MSVRRLALWSGLGVLVTLAAASLVLFAHDFRPFEPAEKLAQVVTGGIWIFTGLVAWQRRPGNRVGPLMMTLGFVDLAHQFYWDDALSFTIGELISFLTVPIAVHLFLAFPSGRVSGRFERSFVAFTYAAVATLALGSQLFWDPVGTDCPQCPQNLLLMSRDGGTGRVVELFGEVVLIAILVTGAALTIRHVRVATGPTRKALAPVLVAAAASAGLLGAVVVVAAAGGETEGSVILWLADLAFAAIPVAFLVGLLRIRLQRSAVADLVVTLGSAASPRQVRDAIASTLGDAELELAYWLPDEERYVDTDGKPVDVDECPGRAVTVLSREGHRVAALVHSPSLLDDPELVEAVGVAASLALENSRLHTELLAQLAEVRASRARIVEAGHAERRRLERDLHDGAQQRLLGIRLSLQLAQGQLNADRAAVTELLTEADAEVVGALEELRALARGLHPAILTEDGLGAALTSLARRAPIPVELKVGQERLPPAVEATAYFVTAEALANVAKHASAASVTVTVSRANGRVSVEVSDDGIGGADAAGGGLRGLRDRVEALDGSLTVDSPIGTGTRVMAAIPCG